MSHAFLATIAFSVIAAAALAGCNQPTKFESASYADNQAITKGAGDYWKRDGWWGGVPKDVKKVAITQFSVEFVTENVNKSGADTLSVLGAMEIAGMGKRKREFAEDFKRQLPTALYQGFVAALKQEGIEVVALEELQKHPSFAEMKRGAAGAESSAFARGGLLGGVNRNQSSTVQSYPVEGLPLVDDGWFNAGNNMKAEWKMVGDTGAQAGMRVHMRVGLDDDGHAVLGGGSTISIWYEPKKEQWEMNKPADWVFKQKGAIVSQGSMRDDVAVIDSKEFKAFQGDVYSVNGPKFQESILKMYPTYARMAVIRLKS